MHHAFKPFSLMLAFALSAIACFAQNNQGSHQNKVTKEETVIIKKQGNETIIELKDGILFVNGEPLISVHDVDIQNLHKKIIIEKGGNTNDPSLQVFGFDGNQMNSLLGSPKRARLGVKINEQSGQIGALVNEVTPGSAAEMAGLQAGDIITRVDGKTIKDAKQLIAEISAQHEPGDKVSINFERRGVERSTTATLQEGATQEIPLRRLGFNQDFRNGGEPNSIMNNGQSTSLGKEPPTPKLGLLIEDRVDGEGLNVLEVKSSSPAAKAGLKKGDVITSIGAEIIGTTEELQWKVQKLKPGEKLKLEYKRAGNSLATELVIPKIIKRMVL